MDRMSEAPPIEDYPADDGTPSPARPAWWRSLQSNGTRRGLLLTALGGLLIAGVITALPVGAGDGPIGLTGTALGGARSTDTFDQAKRGDCLDWPERTPDSAKIVDCANDHRFEVAEAIDMSTFPGSEYGPDAAPPSPARIQQISQEQCSAAARNYLGPKFDPNGKFTVSLLWSGDRAWRQQGERRMLCGLQLPGPNNQQLSFKGKVATLDQSQVWSAGTCLGIDPATNQPTDIPVDCAAPHAMEVTGSVNLAEKFPGPLPAEADQDAFIKDECTRLTDAYLAPVQLRSTTLTLIYGTISLPSWSAGSHQVSCSIGATLGNGGWSTLLNSAKGPLVINGRPPVPPPDIPEERLNLPPIPMPDTSSQMTSEIDLSDQSSSSSSSSSSTSTSTRQDPNQHLPGQSSTANTTEQQAPPQGNTFLNGPPPPPGAPPADAPPQDALPPPGDPAAPPPPAPVDPAAPPAGPAPGPLQLPPPPPA
ncbi:septum formation family protein [Mycolicibacterium grossiae]|nr:septum formation family protein [Mycolicibacterium grossiae]QEM44163.1 hypothetical protein FZ046_04660 [Mycolicibacterium grossiae]